MNWIPFLKRYRTLILGFVALGVFVHGAINVFGVDPRVMLEITLACVAMVVVLAVLGFAAGWVWQKLRGRH
ncbi:MAG: hypothetical protein EP312_05840 [Gammaproteobacteria bacterium]|nr:MAG: hypothetical protein EP312_05840 [Gammaproteobacteria bacterium]